MAQLLNLNNYYTKETLEEKKQESVQYEEPDAGGYVCKIVDAILHEDKKYVEMHLDIAEGKFAGYYQKLEDRAGFWGLKYYASFKESVLNKFIKMCASFETCNPGFTFDPFRGKGADVDTLKGKNIGYVFGYEEYEKKDGTIGTRPMLGNLTEVKKIKSGKFKVPELKRIEKPITGNEDFMKIPDTAPGIEEIIY